VKVLVVDDSYVIRRILVGMLQHECGVTDIVQAADGAEALAVWEQSQLDLVLLDCNMPKLSGIDVLKGIRAVDRRLPIIMITTEAERARIVEAISLGATDYIVKPFSEKTVVKKVMGVLAGKR
jgi:two-component system chemotaxis response regulator CheY